MTKVNENLKLSHFDVVDMLAEQTAIVNKAMTSFSDMQSIIIDASTKVSDPVAKEYMRQLLSKINDFLVFRETALEDMPMDITDYKQDQAA